MTLAGRFKAAFRRAFVRWFLIAAAVGFVLLAWEWTH